MRLLNVHSYEIREFVGSDVPPYANLSHTWGEGEWIDTCCIDKRSSSELSEAINSMYRWYKEAGVCYVYLEDVDVSDLGPFSTPNTSSRFKSSRWFSRGWTLQELIAPPCVVFYTRAWSRIGTRSALESIIAEITGISINALNGDNLDNFAVAEKMSWASWRTTTRVEDEAYCLLGLFGVSMPLIYGEGNKAFRRLQEIIRQSDDESIFACELSAFGSKSSLGGVIEQSRLLALSPRNFRSSGGFRRSKMTCGLNGEPLTSTSPFMVTNKGVQISLPVIEGTQLDPGIVTLIENDPSIGKPIRFENSSWNHRTFAILNCHQVERKNTYIALRMHKSVHGTYLRDDHRLFSIPADCVEKKAITEHIILSHFDSDRMERREKLPSGLYSYTHSQPALHL
ncbi:hypothetical protein GGR58DRAFT_524670 [Xylaria digitata]|nr:hypothetical protein GGR58DRAFT_524670 [Xylaria digitata]